MEPGECRSQGSRRSLEWQEVWNKEVLLGAALFFFQHKNCGASKKTRRWQIQMKGETALCNT